MHVMAVLQGKMDETCSNLKVVLVSDVQNCGFCFVFRQSHVLGDEHLRTPAFEAVPAAEIAGGVCFIGI